MLASTLTALAVALAGGGLAAPWTAAPSGSAAGDCVEIEHALGTACVPADPQRIVSLDPLTALPTLLEVGAPVVASLSVYADADPFPTYLDPALVEGIEVIGSMQSVNLEAIAAADPDLIIGAVPIVEPLLSDLEAIAPTVATRYTFYESGWRDDVRTVAAAVGRSDAIEERFAELDARIAEVTDFLAAQGGTHTLTRVDVFAGQPLYYRYACTWFGDVLNAVGVTAPEQQSPDDCTDGDYESILVYLTLEQLDALDADAIVAYQQQASSGEVGASPLETLEGSPLWAGLTAVQNDRVFVLGDAWGLGGSVTSALAVLDDLEHVVFAEP